MTLDIDLDDLYRDLPLPPEVKADVTARLFTHLEHRTTDLAPEVMEVDRAVYLDEGMAQREREVIFGNVPIVAAHSSEVSAPNDYVLAQLPNNEVIVVRQPEGSVKAFVNVCRHRGARLVMEESGSQRIFSCKYHAWSYDLNGDLRSIPAEETFGDVDHSCLGLVELPAEERHGLVWVVDSPTAKIDVAAWLGPTMDESLASYELDTYVCHRAGNFDEAINWKVLVDAFLDAYHITSTHSGTVAPFFYNNTQIWEPMGRHGRTISPRKSIDTVRDLAPEVASIDRHVTVAHFVMPNMSLLRQPDHFELLNFLPHPHNVGRCRMQMRILARTAPRSDSEAERWDKNWKILEDVLRDEDLVLNRALQRAVSNRDAQPLLLGRNEIVNQHFHSWLERALEDPHHPG